MAAYLRDRTGVPWEVDDVYYGPVSGTLAQNVLLPDWASTFVNDIDSRATDWRPTARQALAVLEALALLPKEGTR